MGRGRVEKQREFDGGTWWLSQLSSQPDFGPGHELKPRTVTAETAQDPLSPLSLPLPCSCFLFCSLCLKINEQAIKRENLMSEKGGNACCTQISGDLVFTGFGFYLVAVRKDDHRRYFK